MTVTWQKFKYGSIERELDLSSVANDLQFIYVDDILHAFKILDADRFEVHGRTIPYMRDDRGIMYDPKRIPCRLGLVIEVIAESAYPVPIAYSPVKAQPSDDMFYLNQSVDMMRFQENRNWVADADPFEQTNSTLARRATTQLQSLKQAVVQANHSGRRLNSEGMKELIGQHLTPVNKTDNTLQYLSQNMGVLVQDVGELRQQGNVLEQLARKMLDMQQQALDRLSLIQSKTEAILTQQLEISEYPIPRLFIVLPEEPKEYDPANWFRTKFRLHFICECGKHTEITGSRERHHLHLAKHEGYPISEPTKFFRKYGPFLLLMLEMIKYGTTAAGIVVPALASLGIVELTDSVKHTVTSVTAKIDYSLECIDKQYTRIGESSVGDFADVDSPAAMTQQDLANYLNNIEGLEGVELRQLGSFLKMTAKDNLLGNLYRMTTSDGHVKWVCRDHYRTGYQEKHAQKIREVVQQAQGDFDEQQGKIKITLTSSIIAAEFYQALNKAKGVLDINLKLEWECSKSDLEMLYNGFKNTRVSILRLEIENFRTGLGDRILLASSQFEPLLQLRDLVHLKTVCLVLRSDLVRILSSPPPTKIQSRLCDLSIEFKTKGLTGRIELDILSKAVKTNWALKNLELDNNRIPLSRMRTFFQALMTNTSLTHLSISNNALLDEGVAMLAEALQNNSTLKELYVCYSYFGDGGAVPLFRALKTNSTLTELYLADNKIGVQGGRALAEVLKINSTLTTLSMGANSIDVEGAIAVGKALEVNSTLKVFYLLGNQIYDAGACAFAKALEVNTALKYLDLGHNYISDRGAAVLAKAIEMNSTLIQIDLGGNSIRTTGVERLKEVFEVNMVLRQIDLQMNQGVQVEDWVLERPELGLSH